MKLNLSERVHQLQDTIAKIKRYASVALDLVAMPSTRTKEKLLLGLAAKAQSAIDNGPNLYQDNNLCGGIKLLESTDPIANTEQQFQQKRANLHRQLTQQVAQLQALNIALHDEQATEISALARIIVPAVRDHSNTCSSQSDSSASSTSSTESSSS